MRSTTALALALYACAAAGTAHAQVCGRADGSASPSRASDALAALRASVGTAGACRLCLCDVDASGAIAANDALAILRKAVGIEVAFTCANCTCPIPDRLTVGTHPRVVRAADVDGDGHLDLVSADDESRSVSLRLNLGNGQFAERLGIDPGGEPLSVTVIDLDGDDALDLVTANLNPSAVAVLRGNGDGTFRTPRLLPAGDSPVNVAAGDVSGDGVPDLLAANSLSNDVSVYVADGQGDYAERPRIGVGVGPRWIELADVTGDGKLDAITANRDSHSVTIVPGNGDATFAEALTVPACAGAHQALPADLDGDADFDLVVPCKAERALAVLIAKGGGAFESARLYDTEATAIAAAVGDIDGDAKLDVAVTHWYPARLVLFPGAGNGSFFAPFDVGVTGKPRGLALADVTGDRIVDVVAASTESDDLMLFPGTGAFGFRTGADAIAFRPRVRDMAAGDFDRNGSVDFVSSNWHAKSGVYARHSQGGRFASLSLFEIQRFPSAVITGDFNGDHKLDFLVKNNKVWSEAQSKRCADPHLALFKGRGDSTFDAELRVAAGNLSHHTDDDFAKADVDADGIDDLVIIERQSAAVAYLRGRLDGQFEVVQRIALEERATRLAVGDFNADGAPDVAWLQGEGPHAIVVRLRNEFLRFAPEPAAVIALGAPAGWLLAGDVDADGRADLVTGAAEGSRVETRLALADGGFSPPVASDLAASFFKQPELLDADLDRALDLVGLQSTRPFDPILPLGGPPLVARGNGDGGFARVRIVDPAAVTPALRAYPTTALLATNLDEDPSMDLVVAYQRNKDASNGAVVYNVGHCLPAQRAEP